MEVEQCSILMMISCRINQVP